MLAWAVVLVLVTPSTRAASLFATFHGRAAAEVCRMVTPVLDEAGKLDMNAFMRVHTVIKALRHKEHSFAIASFDERKTRMCVFACTQSPDVRFAHCVHACLWEDPRTPLVEKTRTVMALRAWHERHFPNATLVPGERMPLDDRAAW